jgi:hypothetical protein
MVHCTDTHQIGMPLLFVNKLSLGITDPQTMIQKKEKGNVHLLV